MSAELDAPDPLVSIVTVTYGTGPIVVDAIDAVLATVALPFEVIVVDNPPADGRTRTAELLRVTGLADRPEVTVVEAATNLGFSGGNNLGVESARGRYVCFLNPDVVVETGWLEPLVAALEDPVVGIAAPVLLDPDGSLQEAGQLLYDDGCTAAVGGPEVLTGDLDQAFTRDVDYASAACWVVRRDEFVGLGGFDERYRPAYFEDCDYALRVEEAGQRSRLVVDVPVVHHHGLGGAHQDLALGRRSQITFVERWEDRLPAQPPRPHDDREAIANRDRLASATSIWSLESTDERTRRRELARAMRLAHDDPRGRVTFSADDHGGLDVAEARRAGVEVVAIPAAELRARPTADGADWHLVSAAQPSLRSAIRSLWSPWTLLVAAIGVVLRVLVMRSPSGYLNSDEAYTGLAAMGVLDGRFPIVLDGNRYTAVFEAYLFAPVTAVFGPSILALKLVPIVIWAFASVVTYVAGYHLGAQLLRRDEHPQARPRLMAAVAATIVWLTPGALLVVSTLAYPSYALGMATCAAILLWAARVIDRDEPDVVNSAVLGALSGLGFWMHPMFLAVIVPLIVPVAVVHRRSVRTFWIPAVVAGLLACGPFLAWNVVNGFPSLDVQNAVPGTYGDRFRTYFSELLPRAFGLRTLEWEWIPGAVTGRVAYGALIAATLVGALTLIVRGQRRSRWLVAIAVVAVWPLMALFSPLGWTADGRYAIIAFPIVAVALGAAVTLVPLPDRRLVFAGVAATLVWLGIYVWPHTDNVIAGGAVNANAGTEAVIDFLDERGIDKIAGSYWRVLVVEYLSDREIIGAVAWPDPIRFPDRQRQVQDSPHANVAFVFPPWAERPEMLWLPPDRYERIVVGDTVVYLPLPES